MPNEGRLQANTASNVICGANNEANINDEIEPQVSPNALQTTAILTPSPAGRAIVNPTSRTCNQNTINSTFRAEHGRNSNTVQAAAGMFSRRALPLAATNGPSASAAGSTTHRHATSVMATVKPLHCTANSGGHSKTGTVTGSIFTGATAVIKPLLPLNTAVADRPASRAMATIRPLGTRVSCDAVARTGVTQPIMDVEARFRNTINNRPLFTSSNTNDRPTATAAIILEGGASLHPMHNNNEHTSSFQNEPVGHVCARMATIRPVFSANSDDEPSNNAESNDSDVTSFNAGNSNVGESFRTFSNVRVIRTMPATEGLVSTTTSSSTTATTAGILPNNANMQ